MLPIPTTELIETKQIVEGSNYDFKATIDLDKPDHKVGLVNDVVAFLNTSPAHIIIGVHEEGGAFLRYHPISGDVDKICRRFLSVLQDNIEPKPVRIDIRPIMMEPGFLLDIDIPDHTLRPYQNRLTGAFYFRTGPKNTPISRDEVYSYFTTLECYENDLNARSSKDETELSKRGVMQTNGPVLHIGVLPREFYARRRKLFDTGGMRPKVSPSYHGGRGNIFKACNGGVESIDVDMEGCGISRFFVGNDWFLSADIVHPFDSDYERVKIIEFKEKLRSFMIDLDTFVMDQEIAGPFCVQFCISGLQVSEKTAWAFSPSVDAITMPYGHLVDSVADSTLIDHFHQMVRSASRFG